MILHSYLNRASQRLKQRLVARGTAATVLLLLTLTAAVAYALVSLVPAGGWVLGARVLLYGLLAAAVFGIARFVFSQRRSADVLEALVPAFAGRLRTWLDADERGERSPMLALLAREVETVAQQAPLAATLPRRQIFVPGAIAVVAAAGFLADATAGDAIGLWAQIFFFARLAHAAVYTLGLPYLRTPVYLVSWAAILVIGAQAAA